MGFGGNAIKSVYDAVAFGGDTIASRDDAAFGSKTEASKRNQLQ